MTQTYILCASYCLCVSVYVFCKIGLLFWTFGGEHIKGVLAICPIEKSFVFIVVFSFIFKILLVFY